MEDIIVRRARVLFVHQVGALGGAGVTLAGIIRALDPGAFESIVACPAGPVTFLFEEAGARVIRLSRPIWQFAHQSGYARPAFHPRFVHDTLRQRFDLPWWRKFVGELRPDIVHLNALTLLPLGLAAREMGARVVCLVQETAAAGAFGVRTAWLRRMLCKIPDAVVFISEYDRAAFHPKGPLVEVVPNWVDLQDFDRRVSPTESRAALEIPAGARVILFMGGISRIKGTLPLFRAVDRIRDIPNLLVLVAGVDETPPVESGAGPIRRAWQFVRVARNGYLRRTRAFFRSRGLASIVRLLPPLHSVASLYAAADVVVFPATAPHQARPVLEAGAMATPVVVSSFINLREFVVDGVNALTVLPGDDQALATALRRVLTDSVLARDLGEGNYRMTCRHHNAAINAPRMVAVYQWLLDRRDN